MFQLLTIQRRDSLKSFNFYRLVVPFKVIKIVVVMNSESAAQLLQVLEKTISAGNQSYQLIWRFLITVWRDNC